MRIKTILILISVVLIYSCGSNTLPEKNNKILYGLNYNQVREKLGLELLTNDFECDCLDPENYLVWVINIDNQVINEGKAHFFKKAIYIKNDTIQMEEDIYIGKNKYKTIENTETTEMLYVQYDFLTASFKYIYEGDTTTTDRQISITKSQVDSLKNEWGLK
jgi:hypothetical protein